MSNYASLNNICIHKLSINLPYTGIWIGEFFITNEIDIENNVLIKIGKTNWYGKVLESAVYGGMVRLKVSGSKNGMSGIVQAKHYKSLKLNILCTQILNEMGERMATTVNLNDLSFEPAHYVRFSGGCAATLNQVCTRFGLNWRTLPNGTVWIGKETWPTLDVKSLTNYVLMDEDSSNLNREYAIDDPVIIPGNKVDNLNVMSVIYDIDDDKLRCTTWYQTNL